MSEKSEKELLHSLASELAKNLKTEKDLSALSREFVKLTGETALGKEMEEHLGYVKHSPEGDGTGNSRNGSSAKTLKGQFGEVEISTPRDRQGTFSPQFVKKGQTRMALVLGVFIQHHSNSNVRPIYGKACCFRN